MTEQRGPVGIVIVDDHAMFRRGVRAELESVGSGVVTILAEAADVDEAIAAVTKHRPQVVLLDVHLPGGGGVEVMRRMAVSGASPKAALPRAERQRRGGGRHRHDPRRRPRLRHQDDHRSRAGAGDRPGVRGRRRLLPRLAGFVLDAFSGSIDVAAVDEDLDRLTEREREVMRLIARGYAYKEVAKELFISIKTVETHMSSVLRKLQLSSRHGPPAGPRTDACSETGRFARSTPGTYGDDRDRRLRAGQARPSDLKRSITGRLLFFYVLGDALGSGIYDAAERLLGKRDRPSPADEGGART